MGAVKEVYKWQIAPRGKTNRDGADLAICNARVISSDSLTVTTVPYSVFKRGNLLRELTLHPPRGVPCRQIVAYAE